MARVIRKVVRLHAAQAEFCHSNALYRAFVGGRGAGKTFCGAYDLIRRARRGRTYMVASPTAPIMNDTTFPTFQKLAREFGVWGEVRLSPYPTATLNTGATVRFRTAEDPEKLRGPNLSGIWLDEASLMKQEAYTICLASLREAGEQGWMAATFTPKGPTSWVYEQFATGKPNTAIIKAKTAENPFNHADFEANLRTAYGETSFARQELDAEFVQTEGAEFAAEWFDHNAFWFSEWPNLVAKVVYVDPSRGLRDKSHDDQAFVMAGLTRDGVIHADCVVAKEPVPQMVARAIDLCRRWWPVDSLVLEDNGTMGFLGPEVERQTREAKLVLPWQLVVNTDPKAFRIRGLATYLSRGQVRLRDTPGGRALRNQLADWPLTEHDDCVDALSGAVRRLEQLAAGMGG